MSAGPTDKRRGRICGACRAVAELDGLHMHGRESCAVRARPASGDVQERGGQPLLTVRSSQMIRGRTLRSAAWVRECGSDGVTPGCRARRELPVLRGDDLTFT